MAVRLNITKKGKIIILICFMLVLAGTGGYLLWRVNQEDTVAPEDSEAGQSNNGLCWECCTGTRPNCPTITQPDRDNGWECSTGGVYCAMNKACNGDTVKCGDGISIQTKYENPTTEEKASACTKCLHAAPNDDEPVGGVECNVGSQCSNVCQWPAVAYCNSDGTCSCNSNSSNGCNDEEPTCTPVCTGTNSTASCTARCSGCNNLYTYTIDCDVDEPENTCDGGSWITKPSGTYKYCDAIKYTAKATDSDGIKESSIKSKLNGTSRTTFTKTTSGTSTTITETLSSSTSCLPAGSYTLNLDWEDAKGETSTACALSTTFTVLQEETNPNWVLTKSVAAVCKNDNTENPTSELTYTITLKNTGNGEGTITKIVDVLDTKVLGTYVSNISNNGAYSSGKITWTLTDQTLAPQEQRTYTYKVTIPKTAFGKYSNSVTAYPSEGNNVVANAVVTANCTIANSKWTLTKSVVEACKNENTENPTSELTYTITLKNVGEAEGTLNKIIDNLDTKVLETYISNISNSGVYSGGDITWTLTDKTLAPQEQRTYTYKVTVPKEAFGKYVNVATAYPASGDNVVADAEITADCEIETPETPETPETGIFDSTWSKILGGIVLMIFGISYNKLVLFSRKLRISILDIQDEARKKNFEKKVVKK